MLREYSVTGVVEGSVPTLTAYRIMSESDFMEIDYDTELLFHEEGLEVEDDPAPALPADGLESLVCGEGQLFTDSQLVRFVTEPSPGPAPKSPTLTAAQQLIELPGTPLHIPDWAQEVEEWEEEKLQEVEDEEELLASDAEEEQQDEGDQQELLPSEGEASIVEVSQEEVVEQVPQQSEPRDPDLAWEARCRASLQASLDCISGKGSRPQPPNTRKLGTVGSALLRDWYQPERRAVWSEGKVLDKSLKLVGEQQAVLVPG